MKKILVTFFMTILFVLATFTIKSNAATIAPEYDATFNNNKGIFYANGNRIEIKQDTSNNTVVYWDGGNQIVPQSVTIIGGGKAGTTYQETNIKMESGTVSIIYGGGMSLDSNSISVVNKSNVTINGGTILTSLYGGGLLFTTTNESNVTINDGTVLAAVGGGAASAAIDGVVYSAGVETDLINSKNRVNTANLTINGGTIDSTPSNYGLVFGGGQGYSYVGTANLKINGGDMSKAYVTSGGSNGYTKTGNIIIKDGIIKMVQSVNRGKMEEATIRIDGGNITDVYVGGENDPSVTGIINKSDVAILGGNVVNLKKGTSEGTELNVDQNNYKAVSVQGTVQESAIGSQEVKITYTINILDKDVNIFAGSKRKLTTELKTSPSGYERLFENEKKEWLSDDETIAKIDENGEVEGIAPGIVTIRTKIVDQEDEIKIQILPNQKTVIIVTIVITLLAMLAAFLIWLLI